MITRRYSRPKRGLIYKYPPGKSSKDYPPDVEYCTVDINPRTFEAAVFGGRVTAETLDQYMAMVGDWTRET